ncbi:hypothetical protein EC912_102566 [Luteibacter rhizovicinus]|uniref:Uncharacterized protein n=1 Tax=Luteibacter rhizovicinus TaxID=242606 RepID=A0A4R3YUW9_9GAMM|nr:hypothetical protein [Luteibacter rhizovicinus]TCV96216.1 hypothetical protein EC912_102566 [Luteibacter rhizovicinus]
MKTKGFVALLALTCATPTLASPPYVHDLDRPFNEYTWVTTHNAFATRAFLFPPPNGGIVCGIPGREKTTVDLKARDNLGCENDDASSATLTGLRAGTQLNVFDSPDSDIKDDYALIVVRRDIVGREVTIPSFERSYSDDDGVVQSHYRNGLDGYVSRLSLDPGQ